MESQTNLRAKLKAHEKVLIKLQEKKQLQMQPWQVKLNEGRKKERERKNDRNNNNSKWAPNYTKNVLKRKSTAKIVLSIFRCQKRKSKENVEREKRWRQKRWKSINSSHCRLLRRGRLKVEKWQKSRGDWANGHGFASAGAARGARERERELRRGKCWQLLSALCSCPADSSCPSSCPSTYPPACLPAVRLDSWHPML